MRTADRHSPASTARTEAGPVRSRTRSGPDPMDTVSLNGDRVRNSAGKELGRVEGVILDGSRDRIAYAVLSLGTVLGRDARLFAVPWSALRVNADDACVVLDIPEERLRAAPGFNRDSWPSITDSGWREEIDTYYGAQPQSRRQPAAAAEPSGYSPSPRSSEQRADPPHE
jgi:sporulation protein YlmC with PRC-barrel domain